MYALLGLVAIWRQPYCWCWSTYKLRYDEQVCREYQRGVCTRTQSECRYAHPPNGMAVDGDNYVTVCMDFIKGRCHRETCRYFHPPPHLQAQIKTSQQRAIVSYSRCLLHLCVEAGLLQIVLVRELMQSPLFICLSICFLSNFWTKWPLTLTFCVFTDHGGIERRA